MSNFDGSDNGETEAASALATRPALGNLLNELQAGDVLDGRFKILGTINRGGMASIYKAMDRMTKRAVAVKVPLSYGEGDGGFYARFQREEMIGLTLDHPSVVKFVRCEVKKSRPYIVMEYLEGRTLAALLNERPQFPEAEAARIASRVCEALEYLHRNGVVHRDLKPENIMLCQNGSLRIMDFGIAKSAQARRLTFGGPSSMIGTPDYIAPEQLQGKRGDSRSDIYALGAMLYVMTTGTTPYDGDNPYVVMNARLNGDPEAPRQTNPQLSPQIEEIILHAMERNPSKRYLSAMAMKAELDDYSGVNLEGRSKRLRSSRFLSAHAPLLRKIALFAAAQAVALLLVWWHFRHH